MEQDTKGLTFRNKNYGTDEFYNYEELEGMTFDGIAMDLWERARRKKIGFRSDVEYAERAAVRQSVKFSWMPPDGTGSQSINGALGVLEFLHRSGTREIFFFFEPLGGTRIIRAGTSEEAFKRHAQEIADQPYVFGVWQYDPTQNGTPQIEKVILDKFRRVVHVFIRPVPRYPAVPPYVVTRPPIQDQCFASGTGELRWARAGAAQQLVWSEHAMSSNPLAELIDELRRKYHVF